MTSASFGQCLSVINGSKSFPFPPDRYNKYLYVDGSFDVNNAFDIDKTVSEPQGLDFDVEMGYRKGAFAYYAYYGGYDKINYENYGVGVDYYLMDSRTFDVSMGVNLGAVDRNDIAHFAYAVRLKPIYDVTDMFAVYARAQWQQRPDRNMLSNNTPGIFEVSLGVQLKFLR